MIDRFSRYCMLVPTTDMKATTVVGALEKWITIFGPPETILSDNGSQFLSGVYKTFNALGKTKLKYTTPYHPECNGMIERLHRWIKERLTLISVETNKDFLEGDDWSQYLGMIQWSYNTTPNHMTNHSPYHIIFGHRVARPTFPKPDEFFKVKTPNEYIEYMNNVRNIIENETKEYQKYYDEQRKKYYKKYDNDKPEFEVGDLVLYYTGDQMVGNVKKLSSNWMGPYEITKISTDKLTYKISNLKNPNNYLMANINQIKIFKPKNESLCIEAPMTLCIDYINREIDNVRNNDLIQTEINMINRKFSDEEKEYFHELTTYEPFSNDKMNAYKMILDKIIHPYNY